MQAARLRVFWSQCSQRKRLCFTVLSDKSEGKSTKQCFYHFGLLPEGLHWAQQKDLPVCIPTLHGKQEQEKTKTFIERVTERSLSGRSASQKKGYSSS